MEQLITTRFNEGLRLAKANGIEVRFEYMHGRGGGVCQVNQRPHLFVDLALNPSDQLQALEAAIQLVIHEDWPLKQIDQLRGWVGSG
ncbi:MAG: hypothetical protein JNL67_07635 [Planctomycetaceae bacterium]|nr:hypothetical protein [Planctomycetaceae bacterium]